MEAAQKLVCCFRLPRCRTILSGQFLRHVTLHLVGCLQLAPCFGREACFQRLAQQKVPRYKRMQLLDTNTKIAGRLVEDHCLPRGGLKPSPLGEAFRRPIRPENRCLLRINAEASLFDIRELPPAKADGLHTNGAIERRVLSTLVDKAFVNPSPLGEGTPVSLLWGDQESKYFF